MYVLVYVPKVLQAAERNKSQVLLVTNGTCQVTTQLGLFW